MTTHILHHGLALCGQPGFASIWPTGHSWVRVEQADEATCRGCVEEYDAALAGLPPPREEQTVRVLRFTILTPPDSPPGAPPPDVRTVQVIILARPSQPGDNPMALTPLPRFLVSLRRFALKFDVANFVPSPEAADLHVAFHIRPEHVPKLFEVLRL